ncbi:DNA ligase [Alteromonas sp. 14N.309.X.WAT.G.H12]|uniref:DNA ligase n=1 Tax=Alteromonas sp. 14N.309.X.WAT.G.H12 TaxID=3120824 RepID=UPI002FD0438B
MKYTCVALLFIFFTQAHAQFIDEGDPHRVIEQQQLAETYRPGIDIGDYLISEKLDGIRGRWTGDRLISRNGNPISAPKWFTQNWPSYPMDGELWTKRNDFEQIASIVMSTKGDERWHTVTFMIFDLPIKNKPFIQRYHLMQELVARAQSPYLRVIPQYPLQSNLALQERLTEVTAAGGEGLMLHLKQGYYQNGRSKHLLKLKQFNDDEAQVLAIVEGKGKYAGMMGSMVVQTKAGIKFKIGSGFSDTQRRHPPAIGSWITFKYYGYTKKGIPRFATFMRMRPNEDNPALQ